MATRMISPMLVMKKLKLMLIVNSEHLPSKYVVFLWDFTVIIKVPLYVTSSTFIWVKYTSFCHFYLHARVPCILSIFRYLLIISFLRNTIFWASLSFSHSIKQKKKKKNLKCIFAYKSVVCFNFFRKKKKL